LEVRTAAQHKIEEHARLRPLFIRGVTRVDVRYEAPETLQAAVALLAGASGPARILAGGTDVIVQMETDLIEPSLIVDIKKIPELRKISAESGGFRIGAAVPGMEIMGHKDLCKAWPGVLDGVKLIGSIQVRGRASIGGNLCNGSPAADSVPPLIAAGAIARIVGGKGTREVPVEQIPTGPGKTSLAKDEIIVSFLLPARPPHSGDAYQRFTPRTEMDIAVVGVGVNLTLDGSGTCTAARVALGAVAPTVLLSKECADALIGTKVDAAALDKLAAAASAACKPIDDKRGTKEYRIKVAGVLARRTAQQALDVARKN
jgi:carbon-monoxide dehydrogenase medium subunit